MVLQSAVPLVPRGQLSTPKSCTPAAVCTKSLRKAAGAEKSSYFVIHPGAGLEACLVGTKGERVLPAFCFSSTGVRSLVPEAEK